MLLAVQKTCTMQWLAGERKPVPVTSINLLIQWRICSGDNYISIHPSINLSIYAFYPIDLQLHTSAPFATTLLCNCDGCADTKWMPL